VDPCRFEGDDVLGLGESWRKLRGVDPPVWLSLLVGSVRVDDPTNKLRAIQVLPRPAWARNGISRMRPTVRRAVVSVVRATARKRGLRA
jgi:hypothetical protein